MSIKCRKIQKALSIWNCRIYNTSLDILYNFFGDNQELSLCTTQLCIYNHAERIGHSKIRLYCASRTIMFSLLFSLIIHGVIDIQGTVRNIWHLYHVTAFVGQWKIVCAKIWAIYETWPLDHEIMLMQNIKSRTLPGNYIETGMKTMSA